MTLDTAKTANLELLNDAITSFNRVSDTLLQQYRSLEEKVGVLTKEVDHKKQLLNSILDSIDIGVVFFDREGIIQMINRAAEELLNVKADSIIGRRTLGTSIEGDLIVPDGGRAFYALISRRDVLDQDGNIIGNVLIFKDISRLRELEAMNERNRRLTAMGELVMKIAHEIRNPLGSIELFAGLLQADLKDSEQGQYARRISNSVRSLVNTLDNMLGFAREVRPKLQRQQVLSIINEIAEEFSGYLKSGNISLQIQFHEEYIIPLDKGLFRQAIINLLINAVQAMPGGGCISLYLWDDMEEGARVLRIRLSDSGPGIDDDRLSSIFEPFYSTKDRGTGLGLSIASGIINAHGGHISVESKKGEGSSFTITLPFCNDEGSEAL